MKIKLSPLEIAIGSIVIGYLFQERTYVDFGMAVYQTYYQK